MAEWIYTIDKKPCYASYGVTAKCSECGWDWFSEDGVGNYHAVFGAFITNYSANPEQADAFLLDNARKHNKFSFCPVCGAMLRNGV